MPDSNSFTRSHAQGYNSVAASRHNKTRLRRGISFALLRFRIAQFGQFCLEKQGNKRDRSLRTADFMNSELFCPGRPGYLPGRTYAGRLAPLLFFRFFANEQEETMTMEVHALVHGPQIRGYDFKVTLVTPYWLMGFHSTSVALYRDLLPG